MSTAAVLLAVATLIGAGPATVRVRAGRRRHRPRAVRGAPDRTDPLAVASSLDVLALCLGAGMAVPDAVVATAESAPAPLAGTLRRGAGLLALGADAATAWSAPPAADPHTRALLRLAARSGSSGAALATGVTQLAAQCRDDAGHAATAVAERAGVLLAGPLGLCFLPAFICLGIIPVVAGLTGNVLGAGLL